MRKSDYAALAVIIKAEIDAPAAARTHYEWEKAHAAREAAKRIANRFAHASHVDKVEFLKACGIE